MAEFSEEVLKSIHKTAIRNRALIAGAKDCACFCCLAHFPLDEVEYWEDSPDMTAVCPRCNTDSVLAEHMNEKVDDDLLRAMKAYWFW